MTEVTIHGLVFAAAPYLRWYWPLPAEVDWVGISGASLLVHGPMGWRCELGGQQGNFLPTAEAAVESAARRLRTYISLLEETVRAATPHR